MKSAIIILIFFVANEFFAQEPLAAYLYEDKWYFIDTEGNEMFEAPEFENVAGYRDGMFLFSMNIGIKTKWVYVNTSGEIVIETEADLARLFRDDRAVVIHFEDAQGYDRTYGIIDKEGNYIVEPVYLDAIDYSEGKTYIMNLDERGFIDKEGNYIFKLDSLVGYPYFEGLAPVSTKEYFFGYIDTEGNMVIEPQFDEAKGFSEGLAAVNIDGKFGFIDTSGIYAIEPGYAFAQKFTDGHCFVGMASELYEPIWGIINTSGLLTVDFEYDDAKGFDMGIGMVRAGSEYYFIDPLGNRVIDKVFTYADEFKDGLAWASEYDKGKHGFINPQGEYVIEIPECEIVIDFRVNRRVYFE